MIGIYPTMVHSRSPESYSPAGLALAAYAAQLSAGILCYASGITLDVHLHQGQRKECEAGNKMYLQPVPRAELLASRKRSSCPT